MPASGPSPSCAAIIVAAGTGSRMGFDKLAADLMGKPVLRRTLDAFLAAQTISSIVVVCPEERWKLLSPPDFTKPVTRTDGGADRQHSVAMGLRAVHGPPDLIAVHDAARPLVSPADIDRAVTAAFSEDAVSLARRVTETVKRSNDLNLCMEPVSRTNLWFMETPQVFAKDLLEEACRHVAENQITVTDEVSALEHIGVRARFIESTSPNPKITTPADLALAQALWKSRP
jgi:2-C-methyl-D-erythritol 4-phosphate cytidylyltransferase